MTATYKLEKLSQLVELATKLRHSWFRGHSEIIGELTPKVFRKDHAIPNKWRGFFEQPIIEDFKRRAPVMMPASPPDYEDDVSWLFLMQHHGTPTRLLDWTENALVAMYFVIYDHTEKDGELWAMHPKALNRQSGAAGILLPRSEIVRYLAAEPKWNDTEQLRKRIGLQNIPRNPIATLPPMNFNRMAAQLSAFTIHPKPKPNGEGTTITEILTDEKHLVRYIVPADHKEEIRLDLEALEITQATLFPDLEGLSRTIVERWKQSEASLPSPPHW